MRTKVECLEEVKRNIRKEHDTAWAILFFSLLFAFVSTFMIVRFSFNHNDIDICRKIVYGLSLVTNTVCFGYISAFAFYYLHDYLPLSNRILEDYQIAYAPIKIIFDQSTLIENKIFANEIPSENYNKEFAERIIIEPKNGNLVQLDQQFWKLIRLNSSIIEEGKANLLLVRSDMKQITFITLGMSLDIYKQISTKNWAVYENDIPIVEYDDLLLVIKNFKKSLEDYKMLKQEMEKYIYFDNYRYGE